MSGCWLGARMYLGTGIRQGVTAMTRNDMLAAMDSVLPGFSAGLGSIFDRMEIAEEEIDAAQAWYPERADEIDDAFALMKVSPLLEPYADRPGVFRAHCRQIATWVGQGKDPNRATDAELLHVMAETSLRAPLNTEGLLLYFRVFTNVFGESEAGDILGEVAQNLEYLERNYAATADVLLEQTREKFRIDREDL